jgi:tetratricopeptide (TPR) repeat protein
MVTRPVVFVSATSDLQSARKLVGDVLYSMGYEPHWQDIQPTDGGEMLAVLRGWIEPSALVIQLVGRRYGAEPPAPTAEFGRVSYTQFEALYAEKAGKKVIYHFMEPGFPTDEAPAEAEELTQLQAKYRDGLVAANKLRHGNIANPADLELSVRRLRDELAAMRAQGERRFRRIATLVAAALAGVAVATGLVLWNLHLQRKTHEHVVTSSTQTADELAAIRNELREALAPKPLPAGQTQPPRLSSELMQKAKHLLERGSAEDQALAKIALKQHEQADRIIQELKSKPGNPIDEAVRLLTMEGDNWYQAGQPDKAIEPYEKAMALRSADAETRDHVVLAHEFAQLGNIEDHQRRAIEVAEGTLNLVPPGSADWARTQTNLGIAYWAMPTGERGENLRKAIAAFEAALTVFRKESYAFEWALAQNNIAIAWVDTPTGDRGQNLRKGIAAYEAALTVYTKDAYPTSWAVTQANLGLAWSQLPTGNRSENLRKAIALHEAALTVYTKDKYPVQWANTQSNVGTAWHGMPLDEQGENLRKAIAAYEAALTVRTKDSHPFAWAKTQRNLSAAWRSMPTGDRSENLHKAITAGEAALTVFTKKSHPIDWAMAQNNLGLIWEDMPAGNRGENLNRALAAYEAALTVLTKETYPTGWAKAQANLGNVWANMPTGDRTASLSKAIAAYRSSLTVYSKGAEPFDWALTHYNLARTLAQMARLPGNDRIDLLSRAIASDKAALIIFVAKSFPREHGYALKNLENHRRDYEAAGGAEKKPFDGIEPAK